MTGLRAMMVMTSCLVVMMMTFLLAVKEKIFYMEARDKTFSLEVMSHDALSALSPFDMSTTTESTPTQDIFVFTMGQGGSMMNMDEIKGWLPGTDKIAFSNDGGNSYVANPFSDNAYGIGQHSLVDQYNGGMGVTMVYNGNGV